MQKFIKFNEIKQGNTIRFSLLVETKENNFERVQVKAIACENAKDAEYGSIEVALDPDFVKIAKDQGYKLPKTVYCFEESNPRVELVA